MLRDSCPKMDIVTNRCLLVAAESFEVHEEFVYGIEFACCPGGGMVDATDLKSVGWKPVPVRVRPRVPSKAKTSSFALSDVFTPTRQLD